MAILKSNAEAFFGKLPAGDVGHHFMLSRLTIFAANHQSDYDVALKYCQAIAEQFPRRPAKPNELEHLLIGAYQIISGEKIIGPKLPFVKKDEKVANDMLGKPGDYERLILRSDPIPGNAAEAIAKLFEPSDMLCIQPDRYKPTLAFASEWASRPDLSAFQFISHNPLIDHADSRKSENFKSPRYLVHEIDDKGISHEQQLGPALALEKVCPLKMIVNSGGKSLHCWYQWIPGRKEQFRRLSIKLGADPSIYTTPLHLVRLPLGTREPDPERGQPFPAEQPIIFWKD